MAPSPALRTVLISSDWSFLREVLRAEIPLAGVVAVHWERRTPGRLERLKAFTGRGPEGVLQALLRRKIPYRRVEAKHTDQIATALRDWAADVALSYKNPIFPKGLLAIPRLGVINLHPSLLPRYRGALPLLYAARDYCLEGGVTAHLMSAKADRGAILGQIPYAIRPGTGEAQVERALIQERGVRLLEDVLQRFARGETAGIPQPSESPTVYARYTDDRGAWAMIDWSVSLQQLWHYLCLRPFWLHRLPRQTGWRKRVRWAVGSAVYGEPPGPPGTIVPTARGYRIAHPEGFVEIRPTLHLRRRGKQIAVRLLMRSA